MMQLASHDSSKYLDPAAAAEIFSAATEHAFDSILVTTADYSIIYVNPAFTAMTGYESGEVLGKTPGILQGPKTEAAVLDRLSSDLNANRPFHGKAINYRKDGSQFMLEWKIVPVISGQDGSIYLVSVQREIAM
jgi:PAS domain S-box-containing protein